MKANQTLGIILVIASLVILYVPFKMPLVGPEIPDEFKPLVPLITNSMVGEHSSSDAEHLAGCMRAAANQFVLDVTRPEPYYKDNESLKWAIKNIGDLSYPIGWKMVDKYPGLPGVLNTWLNSKLTDEFTRQDLVKQLRGMAAVLEKV